MPNREKGGQYCATIIPKLHKFAHSFTEEAIPQPCELPPVALPLLYSHRDLEI
jgi:hypothetical protein